MKDTKEIQKVEEKAPAFNIENLINQAASSNAPVETLERLVALRKQLKDEWAKEQFYKSLAAFQGECPVVERAKKGVFAKYAPLEDIVAQVKSLLTKHGFSYMFDTETNGKMKVICKVHHVAGHSEPTTFDMEIDTSAKMNVSQKYGSALTYAKRYAFCAAFAISVKDEDNEKNLKSSVDTVGIDEADIKAIDESTDQAVLLKLCGGLKKKYPSKLKTLLSLYSIRKAEIEEAEAQDMSEKAAEALK